MNKKLLELCFLLTVAGLGVFLMRPKALVTPEDVLRHKIDEAAMMEYVDTTYNAKLLYPDFFSADTTQGNNGTFYYTDRDVKDLRIWLFFYPPRMFDSVDDIANLHLKSNYTCENKTRHSCILKGMDGPNSEYVYLCKCYRSRHGWASCTLSYEPRYEDAVGRLVRAVKKWKICEKGSSEWFSDLCDILDF